MTVKELIEQLKKLPPDAQVWMTDHCGTDEIVGARYNTSYRGVIFDAEGDGWEDE